MYLDTIDDYLLITKLSLCASTRYSLLLYTMIIYFTSSSFKRIVFATHSTASVTINLNSSMPASFLTAKVTNKGGKTIPLGEHFSLNNSLILSHTVSDNPESSLCPRTHFALS